MHSLYNFLSKKTVYIEKGNNSKITNGTGSSTDTEYENSLFTEFKNIIRFII